VSRLVGLGSFFFIVAAMVCVIVALLVLLGARRRRGSLAEHAPVDASGGTAWIEVGGLVIPVVVLAVAFVASERVMHRTTTTAHAATPVAEIDVTGHQWWWQLRYDTPDGAHLFTTANEIHIPVGRAVRVRLESSDVAHSFWVPELGTKEDMIPGRTNVLVLEADRPGTYRGECSEFCGEEHTRMAFTVVAETPDRYAAWLAHEGASAAEPTDSLAARGNAAFLDKACGFCHTVRGTLAQGVVGPDLTHVASRQTLAAGTLPNTRPMLEGWIMNAPAMKPGTQMPAFPQIDAATLQALVAYLETLR